MLGLQAVNNTVGFSPMHPHEKSPLVNRRKGFRVQGLGVLSVAGFRCGMSAQGQ